MDSLATRRQQRNQRWKDSCVLLAVYGLADAEGLYCIASLDEIANQAALSGVGRSTIRQRLQSLRDQRHIYIVTLPLPKPFDVYILRDHPQSQGAFDKLLWEVKMRLHLRETEKLWRSQAKERTNPSKPWKPKRLTKRRPRQIHPLRRRK